MIRPLVNKIKRCLRACALVPAAVRVEASYAVCPSVFLRKRRHISPTLCAPGPAGIGGLQRACGREGGGCWREGVVGPLTDCGGCAVGESDPS